MLAQPITTLNPSPSGKPISSTSRWGRNSSRRQSPPAASAQLDRDAFAGKHFANHSRQVLVVFHNQNPRLFTRIRIEPAPIRSAAHLPPAASQPILRARRAASSGYCASSTLSRTTGVRAAGPGGATSAESPTRSCRPARYPAEWLAPSCGRGQRLLHGRRFHHRVAVTGQLRRNSGP